MWTCCCCALRWAGLGCAGLTGLRGYRVSEFHVSAAIERLSCGVDFRVRVLVAIDHVVHRVGKLGLSVVALKDGGAVFQVKLDAHTPVAVFKALLNGAYVKGTTTNRFEPTESAEAWALAQLVSEYRGCVAPAVSSTRVKRQLLSLPEP